MKRTILLFLVTFAGFAQTAPGDKKDDQPSRTAVPRNERDRKRPATTIPPTDPKTPTSPTAPRTPVEPADPTKPLNPTKPTVKPPSI